jgi:hypothetical protein
MQAWGRRLAIALAALALGCPQAEPPAPPQPPPTAPSGKPYSEPREPCRERNPLRNPYFGDLHVHTSLSMDANLWDVRSTPDDAHRFARGEPIDFAGAAGPRRVQLERALDFVALTDHSEFLGEVSLCTRPGSPIHDSEPCLRFRGEIEAGAGASFVSGRFARLAAVVRGRLSDVDVARSPEVCGEDGSRCREETRSVWKQVVESAERWNDRSAGCRFSAFPAYEYTATPEMTKVHHNVIFRNANVPALPISWVDEPVVWDLWSELRAQCLDAKTGCEVLTIPHNSNLSNGQIFTPDYRGLPEEDQVARAALRARLEPLVEISQIKGDSECRNDLYRVIGESDELCNHEQLRPPSTEDCIEGTGKGALAGLGCTSRLDFVRYALVEGLREAERIGVNPYKLGIVASTDTHNANPGDTEEASFDGWSGVEDETPAQRLSGRPSMIGGGGSNPGGLAGIWAEENSRDALFDAMLRRETFGTSGTRIQPRFFGGWSYPSDLCGDPELLARGYAGGVPMGGDLPAPPAADGAPVFVVSALRDPGTAALRTNALERIQIVKGWTGPDGDIHQRVYDVAGEKASNAPDLASCEPLAGGADQLCAVWRDPEFDPRQAAVYYARVLEQPSCRWSTRQCNALPEAERPEACSNPDVPRSVQERAWTSPIWYSPPSPPTAGSGGGGVTRGADSDRLRGASGRARSPGAG